LANLKEQKSGTSTTQTSVLPSARAWKPAVLYPLQPAPHFEGRAELLAQLTKWATDPTDPARVVALVAAGGTGKTALAERALAELQSYTAAGVFVWSFYENPQTEAFLREACRYFTGVEFKETGGLLERLQQALTGDTPHLLILDGLERVQATGSTGRPRGELEDPLMKRLLRWLAAGLGTCAKALITSRFPLPDLADWRERGFQENHLHDLPLKAAFAVLRGWGVQGSDKQLLEAIRPLQDDQTKQVHAISVSVLGSYLGKLWDGDITKAPTFDRHDYAASDPKAAKLTRILTSYAERLPDTERDLLARLSVFPRGVTVEILGYVIANKKVAGVLFRCTESRLLQLLEGLRDLGLVFRYETTQELTFTAHPFLRQFFETLHGVRDPKQIHEAVRAKLAPTLKERPEKKPTDPTDLDRYERLIEITRLAGQTQQAFDLYEYGLGQHEHLGMVLGDIARGLRILSTFAADGTPATAGLDLGKRVRSRLVNDWGLFAEKQGDLTTARQAFEIANEIDRRQSDDTNLSIDLQNLAQLELLAGRCPAAQTTAAAALTYAEQAKHERGRVNLHAFLAVALVGLGRLTEARYQFQAATKLGSQSQLFSYPAIWEAEFKLATGNRTAARSQTEANQTICRHNHWTRDNALCDTVLGRCALSDDPTQARTHLTAARAFASRSGNIDVTLRCYHLAAEITRHERDFSLAVTEAMNGIQLADSCGFGHYSIILRLELAQVHLAAGHFQDVVEPAAKALEMSEHPECQYTWGIADGLHLLGVTHARLGDKIKARDYLQRAIEKRRQLEHPGLKESKKELRRVTI
jgi:tetratricopeptide (TPR) repeat protein